MIRHQTCFVYTLYCCTTHTGPLYFVRVRRKHAHTHSRGVSSVLALPPWRIVKQISHSNVRVGQVWRRWADMRFCRRYNSSIVVYPIARRQYRPTMIATIRSPLSREKIATRPVVASTLWAARKPMNSIHRLKPRRVETCD